MGGRKRILTVFGTRPEAIKLFPLIHAFELDARFDSRVCVSAQHRTMLDQVLEIAGIAPDHDLDLMRPDQSLDGLTAALLTGLGRIMDAEQPDWVVVQGDTATAMAGAIAAYYRKIPVAHVEAGLRSGNIHQPWPEEVNRKVIGTIAALHCAPTETSAEAWRRETVDPATILVTGNSVIDALHWIMKDRLGGLDNVALIEPLDYPHFARLLDIATLMLTDSGGVQEEAPALGKPVLVMRETTERPAGVEAGTAKLVGTDADRIVAETERLLDDPTAYAAMTRAHNPFGDGRSAARIVELLAR